VREPLQRESRPENGAVRFARALVIANPVAGRGRGGRLAAEVARGLERAGTAVELHLTRGRGDGCARVRERSPRCDVLVSIGGDGTLREVLDGLGERTVPVALLPVGTANVLALDLGLSRRAAGLLELVARGRVQPIDVADVNGELSFLVTGVGFDGRVARALEARRKGPITKLAYLPAVLAALRGYRAPRLRVEIDGQTLPETFGLVLVSNIVHYGGFLKLAGGRLDDGRWQVYLFSDASPAALARAGLRGTLRSLPGGPSCTMRSARAVRIDCDEPVAVQVDGDARGTTPIALCVRARQHQLLVPAATP
jgi:YegS/Rv2252/BmrU family lipid kinase